MCKILNSHPSKSSFFTDFGSPAELRNEALSIFAKQLGTNSANDRFDHVVVILPPNDTPGFVGNAGVNHWISTLNNLWGLDVMVYMVSVIVEDTVFVIFFLF